MYKSIFDNVDTANKTIRVCDKNSGVYWQFFVTAEKGEEEKIDAVDKIDNDIVGHAP